MVIFAKSGAGKSYTVKLEILRQLMFDTEIIVLDPEHEYEELCTMVGGEYINFTFGSKAKINPFDLSNLYEEGENELGQKILSLHGLLKVMLGEMTPQQEAILDRAIIASYKAKGITPDPNTQTNVPPLMEDLYKALVGMEQEESDDLSARLEKFITGSFRGIFDKASNIDIRSPFTVFSVREMEEELRPIAMYVILDFIWTKIKKDLKKRILVIDEAWYFMMHQDSSAFVYSMVKRARKYYLGITTITQDVEDFLRNDYGRAIVSNSSIQFLMKQSTSSIPLLAQTFYLSEGERQLLITSDVGEGIFFAGQNHVALRVIASEKENQAITTDPEEILAKKKQAEAERELRRRRLEQDNSKEKNQDKVGDFAKPEKIPWQGEKVELDKDLLENAERKAELNLRQSPTLPQIKNIFDGEQSQASQNETNDNQSANFNNTHNNNQQTSPGIKQPFGYSIDDYQAQNKNWPLPNVKNSVYNCVC